MDSGRFVPWLIVGQLISLVSMAAAQPPAEPHLAPTSVATTSSVEPAVSRSDQETLDRRLPAPSQTLLDSLEPAALRELVQDALARNPAIARAKHQAIVAASRAPQARALPDPIASASLYILPAETRAGPQVLSASYKQTFPWFGKLDLKERAALFGAAEAEAMVESQRLDVLTEVRRLFYELAFLDEQAAAQTAERNTLARFERTAQTRYSSGTGLQQEIIRIQAQITSAEIGMLEIREHRASILAATNALRDRPSNTEVQGLALPNLDMKLLGQTDRSSLVQEAHLRRPEMAAVRARIAARQSLVELSEKNRKPDVTLGASYTIVGKRDDPAGRATSVANDGDDILALTGSVRLPIRRKKLDAERTMARAARFAAEEERRSLVASIESSTGDLWARFPLLAKHLRLLEGVLSIQARETLRSAETAYATGRLNAVDLLDAEVVLFDVEIALARTRADWNIARAHMERAIAAPLSLTSKEGATP